MACSRGISLCSFARNSLSDTFDHTFVPSNRVHRSIRRSVGRMKSCFCNCTDDGIQLHKIPRDMSSHILRQRILSSDFHGILFCIRIGHWRGHKLEFLIARKCIQKNSSARRTMDRIFSRRCHLSNLDCNSILHLQDDNHLR